MVTGCEVNKGFTMLMVCLSISKLYMFEGKIALASLFIIIFFIYFSQLFLIECTNKSLRLVSNIFYTGPL